MGFNMLYFLVHVTLLAVDPAVNPNNMNGWALAGLVMGSSVLSVIIMQIVGYKKLKAEQKKLELEGDNISSNTWRSIAEEYKQQTKDLREEVVELRKSVNEMRDREIQFLVHNMELLKENRKLAEKNSFLDRENTNIMEQLKEHTKAQEKK